MMRKGQAWVAMGMNPPGRTKSSCKKSLVDGTQLIPVTERKLVHLECIN